MKTERFDTVAQLLARRQTRRSALSSAAALAGSVVVGSGLRVRAQEASPATCPPTTVEANEALVRRFFEEVWNAANLDAIEEIVAEDFFRHFANRPGEGEVGNDAFRERIRERRMVDFPDLQATIEEIFGEGDLVVTRTIWTGTHADDLEHHTDLDTAATGKVVSNSGIAIFRIACGKIAEQWVANDELGLLQQIGAVPAGDDPAPMATPAVEPQDAVTSPETCQETTPEENKRLVTRLHEEALNGGNLAIIDEIHTEDHRYHGDRRQEGDDPVASDDVAAAIYAEWLTDFPDRQATIEQLVAKGDMVAARWTATGTHQDDFEHTGIAATGQQVSFSATAIYRIACGQIAETWLNWDALDVHRQLTSG